MARYCLQCGTPLEVKEIESRQREYCPVCGWINYLQLKVSAGCRVEKDGCLLLVKRRNSPFAGTWHLPSGYLEVDETPEQGAVRETFEECGLIVQATRLAGAYFYDDDARGNGLVLFFDAKVKDGLLRTSNETSDLRYFTQQELTSIPLAGMSARESISDWLAEKRHG